MKYINIFLIVLISYCPLLVKSQDGQSEIQALVTKTSLVRDQLLSECKGLKGQSGIQIQSLIEEVCFNTGLRVDLVKEMKDSIGTLGNKTLWAGFEQVIQGENDMLKMAYQVRSQGDFIISKSSAKEIGKVADKIFVAYKIIDDAMKQEVDYVYINAIGIKNASTYREITVIQSEKYKTVRKILIVLAAILLLVTILLSKREKWFFAVSSVCLFTLIILVLINPLTLNKITGKKVRIPSWEISTRNSYRLNNEFLALCRNNGSNDEKKASGLKVLMQSYKAVYTVPSSELTKGLLQDISFMESILFPPSPAPDTLAMVNNVTAKSFNPAWFNEHNYTKINGWNKMTGRGNIQGSKINAKEYDIIISKYIDEDIVHIKEVKDTLQVVSVFKRMKPELLLKLKCVF